MFFPEIILEEEDIRYLLQEDVFQGRLLDKESGTNYYRLNPRKFDSLIDIVYDSNLFGDSDKNVIEFNLRTVVSIFTSIIQRKSRLEITNAILSYYPINKENAMTLMTYLRSDLKDGE